jgi:hypothetical protein
MVKNGFAPNELDEYVTNPGVDHVEVIEQLESTICLALALSMLKADFGPLDRRDRGSTVSSASQGTRFRTKSIESFLSMMTPAGLSDRADRRRVGDAWRPLRLADSNRAGA